VLKVYDGYYVRRCRKCRAKTEHMLNDVDKKVVYLDQFALSEIVKAKQANANSPLKNYWLALDDQIRRLVLYQAAIFPDSNVHQDESLLARAYEELRALYESINGEVSLYSDSDIIRTQVLAFARAWLRDGTAPAYACNVDDILRGKRNAWLSPMQISAKVDYSQFIDQIRAARDAVHDEFASLFMTWVSEKPSYEVVLDRELCGFGQGTIDIIIDTPRRVAAALQTPDPLAIIEATGHNACVLFRILQNLFVQHGISTDDVIKKVGEFLRWRGLDTMPSNAIGAHLFAAISRKAAAGQKRLPSRGMMNDIKVISSYAPYVDAMFIDSECASYLAEEPLRSKANLPVRAKIFSPITRDAFLIYLQDLERQVSSEVKKQAADVYGIGE